MSRMLAALFYVNRWILFLSIPIAMSTRVGKYWTLYMKVIWLSERKSCMQKKKDLNIENYFSFGFMHGQPFIVRKL